MRLPWHRQSDTEWWAKWRAEHRWDRLADYNGRVDKGIVHTPEYVAWMEREQEAWREEQRTGIPAPVLPEWPEDEDAPAADEQV